MTRPPSRDRAITRAIEAWFRAHARDLPWRTEVRDPYRALVSEFMLQQTQVDRVVDRYRAFLERFPSAGALAAADLDEVLGAWSGLGYYRRARNLHAAARAMVERFGGHPPRTVDDLLSLPGVGRYTAGAIMSMVHGEAAPIVDGNVRRVLMRVEGREMEDGGAADRWAWGRATELVGATRAPGVFNEGLMELGALVCTPRSPRCPTCPVASECRAAAAGAQEDIPRPRRRPVRGELFCATVVRRDARGRLALRRRPETGLWAGMWESPTLEQEGEAATRPEVEAWWGGPVRALEARFVHQTTHRVIHFQGWAALGAGSGVKTEWRTVREASALGLSNAQRRLLGLAGVRSFR